VQPNYTPDRMVVGIGGQVGEGLHDRINELLGDLSPNGEVSPSPAQVVRTPEPRVRVRHKDSEQAHFVLGVPSLPVAHPDRYSLQILFTVLGAGMSSRLFTEVRERRGLAYYVYASNSGYTDAGSLYSQAGVDIKRVDEAIDTVAKELRRIVDEPVEAEELEKARNLSKGRFVLQTEDPRGAILFGLRREVLEGKATDTDDVLAGLDAVTAEDVQRVARETLGASGLNLALIGPFEDAKHFEELVS
jgi:predicted Zn-dependent peptidase